jgi:hypothetical protein
VRIDWSRCVGHGELRGRGKEPRDEEARFEEVRGREVRCGEL